MDCWMDADKTPFLSSTQRADLPDSSFAVMLPGGRTGQDGRTSPRSLRMFPYQDSSGGLIEPEARQALRDLNNSSHHSITIDMKVAAWKKIVSAFEEHYRKAGYDWKYVPPPRKF